LSGEKEKPVAKEDKRMLIFKVKMLEFFFFAIFAFGIAWIISDLAKTIELPVSSGAIGTTIFGFTGIIGCELMIRWIEKYFFT